MAMEAVSTDLGRSDQEKRSGGCLEFLHQVNGCGDVGEEDEISTKEKDQLESAKAEMGHVREENQRLKLYLDQIVRDYKTLQMQFHGIVKQAETVTVCKNNSNQGAGERGSDLVSLSLGRAPSSGDSKNKEHEGIIDQNSSPSSQIRGCNADDKKKALEEEDQRLKLGLDCKYEVPSWSNTVESTRPNSSPASSFDEQKKEEPAGTWPPSTATKTTRSSEDEVSLQNDNPAKKARVSIRARCDTPTCYEFIRSQKERRRLQILTLDSLLDSPEHTSASSGETMSTPARKRLMRDFKRLQQDPPAGISGAPQDNNIMHWNAVIFGPDDTPWDGGTFKLTLQFIEDYPNKPPTVRFVSRMFHPNIYADGSICLDILQNQWSPIYDVAAILTSIQSLLCDPNPNSPANSEAARLFSENKREYNRKVREIVEQSWTAE
ncbi:hypothetical protein SAY87_027076 [Trapa incisa]|uniref:E2 ubiquitin-conjugating enzyme n=1 Tax=Trapa incisa TaxID=236973 RepID=A0AAN7GYP1_9MYRT|nr:hypothetical protein SAY87_027076 [Trapa incisa]